MKVTQIGFINKEGKEDEVEFDTVDPVEVADLWLEFCCENGLIAYILENNFKDE